MDLQKLIDENIEFCNMETGEYFRAIGITQENGRPVVMIEPAEE